MYTLSCECGNRISVRLAQAGMTVDCTSCHASVSVPTISQLKKLAGDSNPFQDIVEKIDLAIENMSPPFDGTCQQCCDKPATVERVVLFSFLDEREVSDYEGIQPGALGVNLVVGESQEYWRESWFPLLMCGDCHRNFKRSWWKSILLGFAKNSTMVTFLIPIYLVLFVLTFFLPCVSVPVLIMVTTMAIRSHTRKKVNPFVLSKLKELPMVRELIEPTDEYRITVFAPTRFRSP